MEKEIDENVQSGDEEPKVQKSDKIDDDLLENASVQEETKNPVNVRTRVEQLVKSKFVGIVNEIRKNSPPIVVRRWVDVTSEKDNNVVVVDEKSDHEDQSDEKLTSDCTEVLNESSEEKLDEVTESPSRTRISSFTSILTKLNLRHFDKSLETEPTVGSSISHTFTDFYEKFNSNRDRYQSIKTRKMDLKRMLSRTKVVENETENCENTSNDEAIIESKESQKVAIEEKSENIKEEAKDFVLTSTDPKIDWSLKPPSCDPTRPRRNQNIRKIGRCSSENHPSVRVNRKVALSNIGRSFSVAAPDDEINNECTDTDSIVSSTSNIFVTIHEGNNSCPNPSSLHASTKSINVSSDASMLSNSLPISPAHAGLSDDEREPVRKKLLVHDTSFQSDSSYCSSVESLLDARRPDPEAILRACGFGPPRQEDVISRIPKRFLKPSQVRGIDTNEFLKRQKFANQIHDSSAFGYRGLIGDPHIQPSTIVLKIRECFIRNMLF